MQPRVNQRRGDTGRVSRQLLGRSAVLSVLRGPSERSPLLPGPPALPGTHPARRARLPLLSGLFVFPTLSGSFYFLPLLKLSHKRFSPIPGLRGGGIKLRN